MSCCIPPPTNDPRQVSPSRLLLSYIYQKTLKQEGTPASSLLFSSRWACTDSPALIHEEKCFECLCRSWDQCIWEYAQRKVKGHTEWFPSEALAFFRLLVTYRSSDFGCKTNHLTFARAVKIAAASPGSFFLWQKDVLSYEEFCARVSCPVHQPYWPAATRPTNWWTKRGARPLELGKSLWFSCRQQAERTINDWFVAASFFQTEPEFSTRDGPRFQQQQIFFRFVVLWFLNSNLPVSHLYAGSRSPDSGGSWVGGTSSGSSDQPHGTFALFNSGGRNGCPFENSPIRLVVGLLLVYCWTICRQDFRRNHYCHRGRPERRLRVQQRPLRNANWHLNVGATGISLASETFSVLRCPCAFENVTVIEADMHESAKYDDDQKHNKSLEQDCGKLFFKKPTSETAKHFYSFQMRGISSHKISFFELTRQPWLGHAKKCSKRATGWTSQILALNQLTWFTKVAPLSSIPADDCLRKTTAVDMWQMWDSKCNLSILRQEPHSAVNRTGPLTDLFAFLIPGSEVTKASLNTKCFCSKVGVCCDSWQTQVKIQKFSQTRNKLKHPTHASRALPPPQMVPSTPFILGWSQDLGFSPFCRSAQDVRKKHLTALLQVNTTAEIVQYKQKRPTPSGHRTDFISSQSIWTRKEFVGALVFADTFRWQLFELAQRHWQNRVIENFECSSFVDRSILFSFARFLFNLCEPWCFLPLVQLCATQTKKTIGLSPEWDQTREIYEDSLNEFHITKAAKHPCEEFCRDAATMGQASARNAGVQVTPISMKNVVNKKERFLDFTAR